LSHVRHLRVGLRITAEEYRRQSIDCLLNNPALEFVYSPNHGRCSGHYTGTSAKNLRAYGWERSSKSHKCKISKRPHGYIAPPVCSARVCMVGIIRPTCTYCSTRAESQAFVKHLCQWWMLLVILGVLCGWLNLSIASRDDHGSGAVRGSYWSHTPIKQSPSWVGMGPLLHRALALKFHPAYSSKA
jgi:hypothetical protein